jgi:hypothetical protein
MIQRTATVADPGGVRNRAGNILLRARRGLGQLAPQRQAGGNRRCKRAAGAVRVW